MHLKQLWSAVARCGQATAVSVVLLALPMAALADNHVMSITVNLLTTDGLGEEIGTILLEDTEYGLLLTPDLTNLPTAGLHGFHIHENPDCGPAMKDKEMVPGLAAGGHFDPMETGRHEGPYGDGHLGDLPPLYVAEDGTAVTPVLAPRLSLADIDQRSVMIHAMGDNFSDDPAPLGGGGGRVACSVISSYSGTGK